MNAAMAIVTCRLPKRGPDARRRSRGRFVFAASIAALSLPTALAAAADRAPPEIVIEDAGSWDASREDVTSVLSSAAGPLWACFPDRKLEPIRVQPKGGPIVLYQRGPMGEYRVRLDTGGRYWSQYAYQFSHELCHILCGYRDAPHRNHWFEETLCETASLYTLRAMGRQWEAKPPYPNWRDYASSLTSYADDLMKQSQLPEGKSLADWFADHEATLYAEPTNRPLNRVAAVELLPLFEAEPARWEAVTWLNTAERKKSQTLGEFLDDWQRESPARHREFIVKVAKKFGHSPVKIEEDRQP